MTKIKKILLTIILVIAVVALTGCKKKESEIVFITDKGSINDKAFNQGAYEGVKEFSRKHGLSYTYIQPTEANTGEYISAIEYAVSIGAKTIVAAGFLFETPINAMQKVYPDINFILLDGNPANAANGSLQKNVHAIFYAEEQSGFLAGYAAVKDGYRKLGFLGGLPVPPIQRFSHGFIQGAKYAAEELKLDDKKIVIQVQYTKDFMDSTESRKAAETMYNKGVEIIFACGGLISQSVIYAAERANADMIGVDVDQSFQSKRVITSAMKNLKGSVSKALSAIYVEKDWSDNYGGFAKTLTALEDGVGLPIETSRFAHFTKKDYETIFKKLVSKEIIVKKDTYDIDKVNLVEEDYSDDKVKVIFIKNN